MPPLGPLCFRLRTLCLCGQNKDLAGYKEAGKSSVLVGSFAGVHVQGDCLQEKREISVTKPLTGYAKQEFKIGTIESCICLC